MKRVLSVQDLSCLGKCSLTVALPVLSAMGCTTGLGNPVWVESTAVGSTLVLMPMAERMGSATVRLHLPIQERS